MPAATNVRQLESAIERRFRQLVRAAGGITEKMAPTHAGMPDRLVLLPPKYGPHGRIFLVELKQEGERPSEIQKVWHQRARALGVEVVVLRGAGEVVAWIQSVI